MKSEGAVGAADGEGTVVVPVVHADFGPALPALNWVPAPRYLLRRDRVLALLADVPPGRVLEIGCGGGALLRELAARGFSGAGVDRSASARRIARAMNPPDGAITIAADIDPAWAGRFDLVCAFEVLEHIEDDRAALATWRTTMAPGGLLALSVPAHPSRWNVGDAWAGHVRRYTRDGLLAVLAEAGFIVEHAECYGFPVSNLLERAAAPVYARQLRSREKATLSAVRRTEESGSDRRVLGRLWPLYAGFAGVLAMRAAFRLQRLFLGTDRGNGYIVLARRD